MLLKYRSGVSRSGIFNGTFDLYSGGKTYPHSPNSPVSAVSEILVATEDEICYDVFITIARYCNKQTYRGKMHENTTPKARIYAYARGDRPNFRICAKLLR